MRDIEQCELEILAAVGKLLISKLEGHDDVAQSIFDSLLPQFENRYPHHKLLTHILLEHIDKENKCAEGDFKNLPGLMR